MAKKSLIFGLCAAVLATLVGGAFPASAATYWYGLGCNESTATAVSGQEVTFWVVSDNQYSNSALSWQAVGGYPDSGTGTSFTTRFYTSAISEVRVITVTDGYRTATCTVTVNGSVYPTYTPFPTWTPTVTPYGFVSMNHSVRNLTRGGEGTSVDAYLNDRLQFTTVLTTGGDRLEDVRITDALPSYMRYVRGSTTVNGDREADGITSGGLRLSTLRANRTTTIRFEAVHEYAFGGTTQTNSVTVTSDNAATQTLYSYITNAGTYRSPTPYPTVTPYLTPPPYYGGNGALALSLAARNVTRGQSGEHASVRARDGDTIDFVLRVRSQNGQYLSSVVVTDYLPVGLEYIGGSSTLNGFVVADGITGSGLNIGAVSGTGDTVVKFSARVIPGSSPALGVVSVSDTAQARADGAGTVSARMTVSLGISNAVASAAGVKTGPAESVLLALALAALATAAYAAYTRTALFGRRTALAEIGRSAGRHLNFSR